MTLEPRATIQAWLPHLILLVLIGACLALLGTLLAPLAQPLLLAGALAMLTHPVVFAPCETLLARHLPRLGPRARRQVAGVASTSALVVLVVAPLLAIVIDLVGSFSGLATVALGIVTQDPASLAPLLDQVEAQVASIARVYPALPIEPAALRAWLANVLGEAGAFGPQFLGFLFQGTGGLLAQGVMILLVLPSLYAEGGRLAAWFLHLTPLDSTQTDRLLRNHRHIVLNLLNDTLAMACLRGSALGLLAWLTTDLAFLPIACLAAFVSLVPVVGTTMVWLPLALLEWTAGDRLSAVLLGLAAIATDLALTWLRSRLHRRLKAVDSGPGFLLFLGLVGGLLAYGPTGFVIGPAVVVLTILVFNFCIPLYGLDTALEDGAGADPVTAPDDRR